MNSYVKLKTARKNGRPTGGAYVNEIFEFPIELHGDRRYGDDLAIMGGVGFLDGRPVTFLAMEKGTDLESRLARNFGCPKPEGYRKALRLMKQAEKFHRPVICFVDTLGAYPGADAEERGQGQAIAESIMEMMGLRTPVISVVIGEGGSGGALALAMGNEVWMLENATYSILSPEGFASILWKDGSRAEEAAGVMKITASELKSLGIVEQIIPEYGMADAPALTSISHYLKKLMKEFLKKESALSKEEIVAQRYERFRKF